MKKAFLYLIDNLEIKRLANFVSFLIALLVMAFIVFPPPSTVEVDFIVFLLPKVVRTNIKDVVRKKFK